MEPTVIHPPWGEKDLDMVLALAHATLGFVFYYFFSHSGKLREWALGTFGERRILVSWVLIQRMLGLFFMGILPFGIYMLVLSKNPADFGLGKGVPSLTLQWTLGLSLGIVLLSFLNARKPDNLSMYPQIRVNQWSVGLVLWSGLSWGLYLFAYEFLFRGILFFAVYKHSGLWVAIAVNVAVYSLAHLPKGAKESLGAIPFGIIICWLTFVTGSIWLAVLVHLVMALSNEWFSIYFHPEMTLKKKTAP